MKGTQWLKLCISLLILLESVYCMDPITAIGFISAIVTIGDTLKKYAIDTEIGIEELKKTTKLTQDTVFRITNQMSSLTTQVTGSRLQIMTELQFQEIQKQIGFIENELNYLSSTAPSPTSSSEIINSYFNSFIEKFQRQNPDYNLVHALEFNLPGSQSSINTFIEKVRFIEKSNNANAVTSSNKMVYELFSVIGFYIGKAHAIMKLCILIRQHYSQHNIDSDQKYFDSRTEVQKSFTNIMKRALMTVDNYDDYVSHMELKNQIADANKVPMKNVLQNYLEWEPWLSWDNNTCSGSCEDYIKRGRDGGDGCYGELRNCKFKVPVGEIAYTIAASDPTSRIYNGYGLWPIWNGLGKFTDAFEKFDRRNDRRETTNYHGDGRKESSRSDFFFICHTCLCTCDNFNSVHTVRKFYGGKMEPQIDGYVITGVRFVEKSHVIFLQIQIGKLMPLATIDQTTIKWKDLPQDIGSNYIEFGYDFRKFSLDGILMDSKIMTGVQFVHKEESVRLQIYGQELTDFETGTMDSSVSTESASGWTAVKSIEGKIIGLRDGSVDFKRTISQTIEFGVSDEQTDAGQSFVPYFDGTAIEFDKKGPLSGVGFMHYSNDDSYAGYIRPYIMSFKYKHVIK